MPWDMFSVLYSIPLVKCCMNPESWHVNRESDITIYNPYSISIGQCCMDRESWVTIFES